MAAANLGRCSIQNHQSRAHPVSGRRETPRRSGFLPRGHKLFLSQSLLVNATVRATKANEIGILGFGGPRGDRYQPQFEGSVAYLLAKNIAIGAEYRTMPHNLGFTKESDWKTFYTAWFVSKNASLTLAYANLGTIATFKNQQGVYLSAQLGF